MSGPAKNVAALLKRAGDAIRKALIKPPGCTESTGCAVGPCHCAHLAAEAALAAIRKAGWTVVPVEPTRRMLWAADRAPAPTWEMDNPDHIDFVLFAVRRAEWAAMLAAAPEVKP